MAEGERPRPLLRLVQEGRLDLLRDELRPDDALVPAVRSQRYGRSGDTLLHHAARYGHRDVLAYLVEVLGMDVEAFNSDYKRPLHEAASMGHGECVSYLLERGASVDCLKKADWTPLMMACTRQNLEVIKALVEHGANPLLKNKDGWNCFHIASREGHPQVLRYLLDMSPSSWDTESTIKRTPLHTAGASTNLTAETNVESLPLWMLSRTGTSTLPGCSWKNTRPVLQLWMCWALNLCTGQLSRPRMKPSSSSSPSWVLMSTREQRPSNSQHCTTQPRPVLFLLNTKVRNCAELILNSTCLSSPLQEGHAHTIQTLLSLGADVHAKDGKSRSALHAACAGQQADAARILLRAGLQDAPDGTGTLARQLARKPDVIQVFQDTNVSA
ncbi:ankyrin repeat domain-containing protein 16 isoform X5 [Aquila chrysaetos chrysaetos]|uniref:ankyrin repeat domain-containing protein 16 isoform X5 n=1 Tax=Aquila chrysaetos chrysaetos TaxID=223781 RepID=UPI001B7D2C32|nr:ankyrin repeat domain-containing protein 16 isoform X5 [Aquila chrysaetos chrysaetos]XP_040979769.1 ankyrin repeat domain-containing protein 16 isoform X5 [Aquila chrysaetos chrysaetos]XP_040979770.1 ankyrin repeat domain-containing protein 16 isoform X5 [Aquila chrysaetos chrysaetos]